ncbi:MAG TPA: hypothetical protein VHD57_01885 [Vicinamibacterales bacterium]|jgi:hypothetical protein|nr:hypothetical protein [Vicinamibacterales bacterium]
MPATPTLRLVWPKPCASPTRTPPPSSRKIVDEKLHRLSQKSPRLAAAIVALIDDCLTKY